MTNKEVLQKLSQRANDLEELSQQGTMDYDAMKAVTDEMLELFFLEKLTRDND